MNALHITRLLVALLVACLGPSGMISGQAIGLPKPGMPVVSLRPVNTLPAIAVPPVELLGFLDTCGCCALEVVVFPLRITDLAARRESATEVELSWRVEQSEEDFRWFLERRLDAEIDFTEVRQLPDELLLRERYVDRNSYFGLSYYRLRGETPDGFVEYSRVVAVDNAFQPTGLVVYPNPLHRSGSVEVPITGLDFALRLSDNLGRVVWSARYVAGTGNPVHFQFPDLAAGVYLLRWVVGGEVRAVERVVVGG